MYEVKDIVNPSGGFEARDVSGVNECSAHPSTRGMEHNATLKTRQLLLTHYLWPIPRECMAAIMCWEVNRCHGLLQRLCWLFEWEGKLAAHGVLHLGQIWRITLLVWSVSTLAVMMRSTQMVAGIGDRNIQALKCPDDTILRAPNV